MNIEKAIKNLKKSEYSDMLDFKPEMSIITFFIILKSYIMLLVTIMYIILKEELLNEYLILLDILFKIAKAEVIIIIILVVFPFIRNLIIWLLRRNGE